MPATLDQIIAATRLRVEKLRATASVRELESQAQRHVPRGFRLGLNAKGKNGVAVIAELKKASPSKGLIRQNFNPASLAIELEKAGAAGLSVLTDEEFFQGSLENLRIASEHTAIPCLRKDFIVDELQILEARANRADAILLIVAALEQRELTHLTKKAEKYKLDVLCEVHDEDELHCAIDAGCTLIGVNSRDLRTFKVELATAFRLAELMPKNILSVAESGIHNGMDLARLRAAGYGAFLIGESLMKTPLPGETLKALLAEATSPVPAV